MAITAKFQADFTSFTDAVNKAEVQLRGFDTSADNVSKSLTKMVDSFSGRKVIEQATLMANAVEKVGGVAHLTEAELQKVATTAADAATKLRAFGQDVPQNISDLAKHAKTATTNFGEMKNVVAGVASAFGVAFSVGAVVNFGRQVLLAGDSIQKMADQTGLSTSEVQKLNYVAGQSGTSITSLVSAVQNLQQRLGDNDSGAVGAMAKLGINLERFNKLSTYDQMTQLAEAVKGIKDPTEQASVAADLFGKNWKEILPAIKAGMKDVGDQAPRMADETVKSLDRIGDAMNRIKTQTIAWGGAVVVAIEAAGFAVGDYLSKWNPSNRGLSNSQRLQLEVEANDPTGLARALAAVKAPAAEVNESLKAIGISAQAAAIAERDLTRDARDSIEVHKEEARARKQAAEETRKLEEANQRFRDSVTNLTSSSIGATKSFGAFGVLMPDLSGRTQAFRERLEELSSTTNEFHDGLTVAGDEIETVIIPAFTTLPNVTAKATAEIKKAGEQIERSFSKKAADALGDISNILDHIPGKFTEIAAVAARTGQAIAKNLGEGDVFGAVVAGVTGAVTAISKLWTNAEKQINPVRQAFVDSFNSPGLRDGLDVLNKKAHDVGLTLDRLLNAKNPKQYQAAIDELTAAFARHDEQLAVVASGVDSVLAAAQSLGGKAPGALKGMIDQLLTMSGLTADEKSKLEGLLGGSSNLEHITDTAAKYGLTLDDLGGKTKQLAISTTADQILSDFSELTDAGADYGNTVNHFADQINDLVHDAMKFGSSLPTALRPIAQALIDSGQLTDDTGKKLEDLSGLTFSDEGDPLTKGLNSLEKTLRDLIDLLSDMPNKAASAAAGIGNELAKVKGPEIPIRYRFEGEDAPIAMASGGSGRVDKPTLFLAGEAGPEDYWFSGGGRTSAGGDRDSLMQALLQALQQLPDTIAMNVGAAVAKAV